MKMAAATAEARTTAAAAMALVTMTITLVALAIAHFVTRNVVVNVIACVVAIPITFVSVRRIGQW